MMVKQMNKIFPIENQESMELYSLKEITTVTESKISVEF